MATHDVLHGIGVSAGTAAAPAAIVQPAPGVDTTESGSIDAAADGARVREALAAVSSRLSERAAKAPEETKAIRRLRLSSRATAVWPRLSIRSSRRAWV